MAFWIMVQTLHCVVTIYLWIVDIHASSVQSTDLSEGPASDEPDDLTILELNACGGVVFLHDIGAGEVDTSQLVTHPTRP